MQIDADLDPAYHFDADPDSDPTYQSDADPSESATQVNILKKMHEINRNLRYDLFAEPGRCSDE